MSYEAICDHLTAHGIKPSVQRIAVMEYLMEHPTHPTVEEIYGALTSRIPTLSKTTVYNTLRLLSEQGAARMLTIDERKTCFDGETGPHAHFLCTECGRIYDIALKDGFPAAAGLLPEGFEMRTADTYFRGRCPQCRPAGKKKE